MNTLRLLYPEWQAGAKEDYYWGARLLAHLVPGSDQQSTREVPVMVPDGQWVPEENGVVGQQAIRDTIVAAKSILEEERPDAIITLGGNCIVSQAPFDYLHGLYGDRLGVIWIDAHPDISTPAMFNHEHAMVWANLMHRGDAIVQSTVEHPFTAEDVLYVGLQPLTAEEVPRMKELGMAYTIQPSELLSPAAIQGWIETHGFTKLAVHWDLDVLHPDWFHSLYFNEPGVPRFTGSSHGMYSVEQITTILQALQGMADIVGFTVAEYLPWDAIRLRRALSMLSIFKDEHNR